jgi:hypothetical protein
MNIEALKITIREKEYTFLKPSAATLIDLEDSCYEEGKFSGELYMNKMLRLVSPELKAKDFVFENFAPYMLESGETITPKVVSREVITDKIAELTASGGKRTAFSAEFLRLCGAVDPDISQLTYEDINGTANAFTNLFDESELNEVVDRIYTFCFK